MFHRCGRVAVVICALASWALVARAAEGDSSGVVPDRAVQDSSKVQIVRLPDGRLRIGSLVVDADRGSLEIPGHVNMTQGVIEVLACAPWGKTYESLFVVDAEPYLVQIGLLLLWDLPPGAVGTTWKKLNEEREFIPSGPELTIRTRWRDERGKERSEPVERWICSPNQRSGPKTSWVFTGSVLGDEGFVAQNQGNIIVTYRDPAAIVNNGAPSSTNDEVYGICSDKVPAAGTPVTLVLSKTGSRSH
jgi:hypothetical protein